MGIKCDNHGTTAECPGIELRLANDMLMAQVDTIKHSKRRCCGAPTGLQLVGEFAGVHPPGVRNGLAMEMSAVEASKPLLRPAHSYDRNFK